MLRTLALREDKMCLWSERLADMRQQPHSSQLFLIFTGEQHQVQLAREPTKSPNDYSKLADPSGFAWLALGSAMTLYAVNVIGSRGIELPNAATPGMLALGAVLLALATISE